MLPEVEGVRWLVDGVPTEAGSYSVQPVTEDTTVTITPEALEGWLDRALEDEEWAFESVLSGALGRDSESEGRKEAREAAWDEAQEAAYQAVGITVDGKERYYQGQRINVFLDIRADRSFYTLDVDPAGTVDVKVLRGEDGEIAGAAYMTDAEIAELFGQDR